ncbi:hypothetical protein TNCV_1766421 [Trichonephila clavipes]|nr:hypothetical protein TNCV_1766421 [Trichonephila clavipes]
MPREGAFHHLIIDSYPRQDKRSKGNGCAIQHDFMLLTVRERLFEEEVFKANVDVITTQLQNRFESMNGIYKSFSFLSPKNIVSTTNDLLYNEASNLQKVYSLDLSSEFPNQIMSLKAVFSEDLIKLNSIKDLVTSAMVERSFSKLKLIKNYLRCTMSEEMLSYLSLISIEQQEARKIELDELITDFAKKNNQDSSERAGGVHLYRWVHHSRHASVCCNAKVLGADNPLHDSSSVMQLCYLASRPGK